jgi:hypothetical protein
VFHWIKSWGKNSMTVFGEAILALKKKQ